MKWNEMSKEEITRAVMLLKKTLKMTIRWAWDEKWQSIKVIVHESLKGWKTMNKKKSDKNILQENETFSGKINMLYDHKPPLIQQSEDYHHKIFQHRYNKGRKK